jgi:hypothetical protein
LSENTINYTVIKTKLANVLNPNIKAEYLNEINRLVIDTHHLTIHVYAFIKMFYIDLFKFNDPSLFFSIDEYDVINIIFSPFWDTYVNNRKLPKKGNQIRFKK